MALIDKFKAEKMCFKMGYFMWCFKCGILYPKIDFDMLCQIFRKLSSKYATTKNFFKKSPKLIVEYNDLTYRVIKFFFNYYSLKEMTTNKQLNFKSTLYN